MASQLLNLDQGLVEQANVLADLDAQSQVKIIDLSMEILEGNDISDALRELCEQLGANPSKISRLCTAISALLWECTKYIVKEVSMLPQILLQVGMNENIVNVFAKGFADGKRRLNRLKGPLGLDTMSYSNLAWRLEVEVAKRSLLVTTEPTFQLRLDLINNATSDDSRRHQSHHLQCDYANLKLLQSELQRAIDEHAGVHSQRISRYIS